MSSSVGKEGNRKNKIYFFFAVILLSEHSYMPIYKKVTVPFNVISLEKMGLTFFTLVLLYFIFANLLRDKSKDKRK